MPGETFKRAVHFTLRHPLFSPRFKTTQPKDPVGKTEQGIWWEFSPYYAWFECLKRNRSYARCCERGGKGRLAKLYEDFGDVRTVDFKMWWTKGERGARLFGEPATPVDVKRLSLDEAQEFRSSIEDGSTLLVAIPLRLDKRTAIRMVRSVIDKAKPSKRGDHLRRGKHYVQNSRAKYRPAARVLVDVVMRQLKAWDARQNGKRLKEIGGALAGSPNLDPDYLVLLAHRLIKSAEAMIEGVGRGEFPIYEITSRKS